MRRKQIRRRIQLREPSNDGLYLKKREALFIPTGCTLLDCAIGGGSGKTGGGWPLHRITNIIGDKSTGKTLLAIESVPNFFRVYQDGEVFYHEVEAAFDKQYAASLGMPVDRVTFVADDDAGDTVEDFFENLTELCDERIKSKAKHPVLYILDSVDALSDRAEQERRIDQGTYGTKAKQMSEVFRRLTKKLARARVTLILISQVRAKMDAVVFGKKTTRSGGKALDFYSSLIIELAEVGKDYHEVRGVKRPVAINVACQVTKNKVGPPFRNVHFPVVFNYGIDSELASFDWLRKQAKIGIDGWRMVGYDGKGTPTVRFLNANRDDAAWVRDLDKLVCSTWGEVEKEFMPPRRKYD